MSTLVKIAMWLGFKDVPHLPISTFQQDSRLAGKGSLFFALPGERRDGCEFLEDVAKQGAFGAIVPKTYTGNDFGMTLFHVEDVLETMHLLARKSLAERSTKVVGITGSVGKTTTRHFLTQLLSIDYSVAYPPQNHNSQRTMPLVILNAKGNEDFIVLEMGMDQSGEIEKLVSIAPTDYAILTPVVLAHYFAENSGFDSLLQVAAEKAKIFCDVTEFAVVNAESALFECVRDACMCDHMVYPSHLDFDLRFKADHIRDCLSGAIEMALHLGISERKIRERIPLLKTFERRFEKIEKKGITFINDSYNAAPISCVAAFRNIPKPKTGKKIAIFGSMGDLGDFSYGAHVQVGREALSSVDEIYCIGEECRLIVDLFKREGKTAVLFDSVEDLKDVVENQAEEGDVVLVKGSNFHKLWELIPQ